MNYYQIALKVFNKLRKNPKSLYYIGKAFIRGFLYANYYRFFKRNIIIKMPFFAYAKLNIGGIGSVFIDRGCSVHYNTFDGLNIITLSTGAQVLIGKRCHLGGTTIRCQKKIVLGDDVMAGYCLVQDTMFSANTLGSLKAGSTDILSPLDIWIGSGVWLADQTIVLWGSKIGDSSVLSIGGLCCNYDIPPLHFAAGNPVFRSASLARIDSFRVSL